MVIVITMIVITVIVVSFTVIGVIILAVPLPRTFLTVTRCSSFRRRR